MWCALQRHRFKSLLTVISNQFPGLYEIDHLQDQARARRLPPDRASRSAFSGACCKKLGNPFSRGINTGNTRSCPVGAKSYNKLQIVINWYKTLSCRFEFVQYPWGDNTCVAKLMQGESQRMVILKNKNKWCVHANQHDQSLLSSPTLNPESLTLALTATTFASATYYIVSSALSHLPL